MRVAVVYPIEMGDVGHVGGGERYALEMARGLSEKVDTRLVTFGAARRQRMEGKLRFEVFPRLHLVKGRLNNPFNPAFLTALRDVDVIHCVGWNVLATDLSILFARATGKRVFVSDVGGGADFTLQRHLQLWRLVHRFLFLTHYAASLFPRFAPGAGIIYGGADVERFSPAPVPRERRVLYVGRIIAAKGIEYLIEAVEPGDPLLIMGRPYEAEYFADLKQRAAGKDVTFITDADDQQLLHTYRSSTVTVLPSVKRSNYANYDVPNVLGLTLLESMACGTPVVCTDTGPEPELVKDGETGFVVPPNDAPQMRDRLKRLLDSPALAEQMGRASRAHVLEHFTWERTAQRCLDCYNDKR